MENVFALVMFGISRCEGRDYWISSTDSNICAVTESQERKAKENVDTSGGVFETNSVTLEGSVSITWQNCYETFKPR